MKNNIALLVVDIQKDATELKNSLFKNTENFIGNVNEVIEMFSKNNGHIFYITHELENNFLNKLIYQNRFIKGTDGSKIDSRIKILSNNFYTKNVGDSLTNVRLERELKRLEISEIYIVGLDAKYCIFNTGKGAVKRGYTAYVLKDCVLTKNMNNLEKLWNNYTKSKITVIQRKDLY